MEEVGEVEDPAEKGEMDRDVRKCVKGEMGRLERWAT